MDKIFLTPILLLFLFSFALAQQPQDITKQRILDAANQYVLENIDNFGVSFSDLKLIDILPDISSTTSTCPWTVIYNQSYKSIPVYGGRLVLCIDKNAKVIEEIEVPAANDQKFMVKQSMINSSLVKNINISVEPKIDKNGFANIVKQKYPSFIAAKEPTLLILGINYPKLVWFYSISLPIGRDVYVDAQNGEILWDTQNWVSGKDVIQNPIQPDNLTIVGLIVLIIIVTGAILVLKRKK